MTIHFICRGNVLRSVMAEAYLRSLNIPTMTVMSSGTVAERDRQPNIPKLQAAQAILAEQGLGVYTKQHAEQLTPERLQAGDLTICMNDIVVQECAPFGPLPPNLQVWDVVDLGEQPYPLATDADRKAFREATLRTLMTKVNELVNTL